MKTQKKVVNQVEKAAKGKVTLVIDTMFEDLMR